MSKRWSVRTWKIKGGRKCGRLIHTHIEHQGKNGTLTTTTSCGIVARSAAIVKKLKRLARQLNIQKVEPDDLKTINAIIKSINHG